MTIAKVNIFYMFLLAGLSIASPVVTKVIVLWPAGRREGVGGAGF